MSAVAWGAVGAAFVIAAGLIALCRLLPQPPRRPAPAKVVPDPVFGYLYPDDEGGA